MNLGNFILYGVKVYRKIGYLDTLEISFKYENRVSSVHIVDLLNYLPVLA